jgi:PadR family transcriptional regulator AphA
MRHCFEYFWPRADARVYAEAKALAAQGLVHVRREMHGRRPTTTYTISSAGRKALERWLADPPKPVALEFEALVKVFLARLGTREQLLATLETTIEQSEFMLQVAGNVRQIYVDGCAPFQDEYVHTWAFVYDFLTDYFAMLHDWASRTEATVRDWDDLSPERKREAALELFAAKRPQRKLRGKRSPPDALPGAWQQGRARPRTAQREGV